MSNIGVAFFLTIWATTSSREEYHHQHLKFETIPLVSCVSVLGATWNRETERGDHVIQLLKIPWKKLEMKNRYDVMYASRITSWAASAGPTRHHQYLLPIMSTCRRRPSTSLWPSLTSWIVIVADQTLLLLGCVVKLVDLSFGNVKSSISPTLSE